MCRYFAVLAVLFFSLSLFSCDAAARTVRVNVSSSNSGPAKLAEAELRNYLGKMFHGDIVFTSEAADIIAGVPSQNPLVLNLVQSGILPLPEGANSEQGYTIKTIDGSIFITGKTDEGVLYGVYELLEGYGAYFQFEGEKLPPKTAFKVRQFDITRSPVFKYRGLLPWDNFLCGMSGYNLEDYQEFIDRATRMKFNLLQFHFYPGMAFFTEKWDGQSVNPRFIGMPVDVFRTRGSIGERAFGGVEVFGPKPYVNNIGNPAAQAEAVQQMMKQVINYARNRGWKTCVGFELMHPVGGSPVYTDKPADNQGGFNHLNPLIESNADLSVKRFRALAETYPRSDYYWMWQTEASGYLSRNVGREAGAEEFRRKYAHWASTPDFAGDIDYAYLFREVALKLTADERARLATGGWSIEHLFPRIHPEFPEELIFASLNSYHQPSCLSNQIQSFKVAEQGRKAWMIDWWEFDGCQWFPQFRCSWQEKMYKNCVDFGVESVSLLGWKISGLGHNVRYLADFSWQPSLTADDFYAGYIKRIYGSRDAGLTALYKEFDAFDPETPSATPPYFHQPMLLGPGWMDLAVPTLANTAEGLELPSWKATVSQASEMNARLRKLVDMDTKAIKAFRKAVPSMDREGRRWAEMMINRFEFRILYTRSVIELNHSIGVYDSSARQQGFRAARQKSSAHTAQAVVLARQAIEKYADVIWNRGDQGVIAQLNEQFHKPILTFHRQIAGESSPYVQIDNTAFRINPLKEFDFSLPDAWKVRDGLVKITNPVVDGQAVIRLEIGGDGKPFHSAHIIQGEIDISTMPYMDFHIRTETTEPLAIMFQLEAGGIWYALNLVGNQSGYTFGDGLPMDSISDGKWHRVTWNLEKLCKDKFGLEADRIINLIVGSWSTPSKPIVAEFRSFRLGSRNTLN